MDRNLAKSLTNDRLNILAIWFSKITSVVVPLATVPILMVTLGMETFGLWQFSAQLAAALLLLDLGVTNASVRIFAKVENSKTELSAVKSTMIVFIIASTFLLLIAGPSAYLIDVKLQLYPTSMESSFYLFLGCFIYAGMCLPLRIFTAYLFSRHRYVVVHISESLLNITKLFVLYFLVNSNNLTLTTTFLTVFGCQFLAVFIHFGYAIFLEKDLFVSSFSQKADRHDLLILTKQSFASVKVTIGALILNSGFIFFLGSIKDFATIALVSLAFYILVSITPFFQSFVTVMSPRAAKIRNDKNKETVINTMITTISISMTPFYFFACNIWYFGYNVFEIWLPLDSYTPNFASDLARLLAVLIAGYTLTLLTNLARALILGAGDFNKPGNIDIVTAIVGLITAVALHTVDVGIMSIAVGYCVALVIRLALYLSALVKFSGYSVSSFIYPIVKFSRYGLLMLLAGSLPYPRLDLTFDIIGLTASDLQAGLAIFGIFCIAIFRNRDLYVTALFDRKNA